ncbi:MAG TPA: ankyrin repeat domain-containing protein [Chloroflexia bacterium]|nr:ankyrin repeat domain-containing protein [Chloroflexia bacterium]
MNTPVALSPELIEEFVVAAHGNFPKVQEMLERAPQLLNAKWLPVDENALEASGHMGRADIAEYVLGKGAPLTIFAAAMLGQTEDVAAFLRDAPELAEALGVHGISILYHAALSGKIEIVDLLVAHGGGDGVSSALHAAVGPGHREMAAWLLARGADPNTPNFQGQTPLDVAQAHGHTQIAEMLQARGGVETGK